MDEHLPDSPEPRPAEAGPSDTANPHRATPPPNPQEGRRTAPDADRTRPEEEERLGPVEGLVRTSAAQAAHEVPVGTPAAEAEVDHLGIEEEGIESSQILGLLLATIAAIACLVIGLYFLFYLPKLNETERAARDVPDSRRIEQRELRVAAEDLLGQYAADPAAEGRYRIPIEAAMQAVVRDYSGRPDSTAGPVSRADYNLSWIDVDLAPATDGAVVGTTAPGVEASGAAPAEQAEAEPAPSIPSQQ